MDVAFWANFPNLYVQHVMWDVSLNSRQQNSTTYYMPKIHICLQFFFFWCLVVWNKKSQENIAHICGMPISCCMTHKYKMDGHKRITWWSRTGQQIIMIALNWLEIQTFIIIFQAMHKEFISYSNHKLRYNHFLSQETRIISWELFS